MRKLSILLGAAAAWALATAPCTASAQMPMDLEFELGTGVSAYTSDLGELTDPGLGYGLRIGTDVSDLIGLDLMYRGAINPLEAEGSLLQNGGILGTHLNLVPGAVVKPQLMAGVGFMDFNVTDSDVEGAPGSVNEDFAWVLPVGAGLVGDTGALLVSGRFVYDFWIDEDVRPEGEDDGNPWKAMLGVGAEF